MNMLSMHIITTAEDAATKYNEQLVSRREYQAKEREKEDKIKAYDERIEAGQPLSKLEEEE